LPKVILVVYIHVHYSIYVIHLKDPKLHHARPSAHARICMLFLKESEAHEALSLLFHRDGFPNVMVMDGAKVQTVGQFRRKLRDAGFHIKQTGPHTQSSNMGEGGVCELKRGVGRKMLRYGCPKRLWDDCIIREAYVRSHTSLDIFGLKGQVTDSKVKGETLDISTISEYDWYK
jgi:hypothetical protein